MTFTAPIWLALAAAAALGVLVAHLFSPSVPRRERLPTTRFIPADAPLAVLRTNRLSDWLLLLLRLTVCILLGLALAGAHVPKRAPARVLIVDGSRAVASVAELRDSARARDGDVVIVFDSVARRATQDTLPTLQPSGAKGSVSAALVAAHRALQGFGEGRAESELVVVSPFTREEVDSATALLLQRWEGPVRLVRVGAATAPNRHRVEVRAQGDDPVAATFALRPEAVGQPVRVIRTRPTAADSAWARDAGGVLVLWPVKADSSLEPGAQASAVVASSAVVVARFARADAVGSGVPAARWSDGAVAASESPLGAGCVRTVEVGVDPVGDLALRASFRAFAYRMVEPCSGARDFAPVDLPRATPAAPALQTPAGREPVWFALLALVALIAEQVIRARGRAA